MWDKMAPHVLNCPWGCTLPWKLWSQGVAPTPRPRLGLSLVLAAQGMGVSPGVTSEYVSWPIQHRFGGFHQS